MVARSIRRSPHYASETSSAWLAEAGAAITENQIVYVSGVNYPRVIVKPVPVTADITTTSGALFIALGSVGIGEPVSVDRKALLALTQAGAIRDKVYIGDNSLPAVLDGAGANMPLFSTLKTTYPIGEVVAVDGTTVYCMVEPQSVNTTLTRPFFNLDTNNVLGAEEVRHVSINLEDDGNTDLLVSTACKIRLAWITVSGSSGAGDEVVTLKKNGASGTAYGTVALNAATEYGANDITMFDELSSSASFAAGDNLHVVRTGTEDEIRLHLLLAPE